MEPDDGTMAVPFTVISVISGPSMFPNASSIRHADIVMISDG